MPDPLTGDRRSPVSDRPPLVDGITGLALASTRLHPDDIPAVLAEEGAKLGMTDLTIYLSDLDQRLLLPMVAPGTQPVPEPLAIDGTLGGRAYRTEHAVTAPAADLEGDGLGGLGLEGAGLEGDAPGGDAGPGRTMLWLPLLDSAERLGVIACCVDGDVSHELLGQCQALANLAAEILANKSVYGDTVVRTRRTQEMTISAELRWSTLPPLTYTGRNMTMSGVVEPAYSVAGDAFDYAVNGDVAHVAIVDAVGHGLEAARIANLAIVAYRHSRRRDLDHVETYRAIDQVLAAEFGLEKFVTAQLATLTLSTGRLSWLNAGHPPPIVVRRRRRLDLVAEPWLPMGLGALQVEPEVAETFLEPGDYVLFFTDGVVEARSADGVEFGRERLADLMERTAAAGQTTAETVRLLGHAVLDHQVGVLQDDATLFLVEWHGPPGAGKDVRR